MSLEPSDTTSDVRSPTSPWSFSAEQISCPVVIEIFSGSTRVTAALKVLGLHGSFGVDHFTDAAISSIKKADLTTSLGQKLLMNWWQSPLVVGIFLAPPCGTCSLARTIALRDSKGRRRSKIFPEGLPHLSGANRRRVSAANKLYHFVSKVLEFAHYKNLIVVVENPRSSLYWMTRYWRNRTIKMMYTAHQACAYGSSRPKWTVLAHNHIAFRAINRCCPGESANHIHQPWGIVRTTQGTHFATSEETAYPKDLASAIAKVFAQIMMHAGWEPPHDSMQAMNKPVTLQQMRAVANV